MNELKPGDRVQLISGGPQMTIRAISGGRVECTFWHEKENRFEEAGFEKNELQHALNKLAEEVLTVIIVFVILGGLLGLFFAAAVFTFNAVPK